MLILMAISRQRVRVRLSLVKALYILRVGRKFSNSHRMCGGSVRNQANGDDFKRKRTPSRCDGVRHWFVRCPAAPALLLFGGLFLGRGGGLGGLAFGGFGLEQRGGLLGRTLRGFRRLELGALGLGDQRATLGEELGLVG
jgi:hypothetical protein